jgi:hypothetical protein
MKETGLAHWKSPNEDATNSSGFTGLPGGIIDGNGRSTALAATVTGGVLRMPILHTPGTASCLLLRPVSRLTISLSVSQCVASRVNTLCHFDSLTL